MVDASWSVSPLIPLAIVAIAAYVVAWRRAQRRGGESLGGELRLWCAFAALFVLVLALMSPIARLGEQMVSLHMLQHVMLLDLAPILIVLAITPEVLGSALPKLRELERRLRPVLHPVVVLVLYAGGIWLWHVPALYELAVSGPGWHVVQHALMLATGLLFWWYAIGAVQPLRHPRGMAVFAFVTSAKLLTGALATVILGTSLAAYRSYQNAPRFDGLDAADDRAIAGAIMLFEELTVMSIALAVMFIRMLGESDEEDRLADATEGSIGGTPGVVTDQPTGSTTSVVGETASR